jgi:hypothetical protein
MAAMLQKQQYVAKIALMTGSCQALFAGYNEV